MAERNALKGSQKEQWQAWKDQVLDQIMPEIKENQHLLETWARTGLARKIDEKYASAASKLAATETDPKTFNLEAVKAGEKKEDMEKVIAGLAFDLGCRVGKSDPELAKQIRDLSISVSSKSKKEDLQDVLSQLREIVDQLG